MSSQQHRENVQDKDKLMLLWVLNRATLRQQELYGPQVNENYKCVAKPQHQTKSGDTAEKHVSILTAMLSKTASPALAPHVASCVLSFQRPVEIHIF